MSSRSKDQRARPTALGEVLDETRQFTQRRARSALDAVTWRHAVGTRIAERTEVGQLRNAELTIFVASAAWAQELSLLAPEIIERLSALAVRVERVRFRVQTKAPAKSANARAKIEPARLTELPAELKSRLERVDDDELRGAIAKAAGLAISRMDKKRAAPISAPPDVRNPRAAGARSAPKARSSAASREGSRRKREGS